MTWKDIFTFVNLMATNFNILIYTQIDQKELK